MLVVGLLGSGIGETFAADPLTATKAIPTVKEYLTKETITGTLMNIEEEYYYIRGDDDKTHRIHVDKSTHLDRLTTGDQVKALVTEMGHTTTLRRVY
jgi:hypothetical protein